jgi:hypothetical protein
MMVIRVSSADVKKVYYFIRMRLKKLQKKSAADRTPVKVIMESVHGFITVLTARKTSQSGKEEHGPPLPDQLNPTPSLFLFTLPDDTVDRFGGVHGFFWRFHSKLGFFLF